MPNPSITRSKSVPCNISETQNSPTNSFIVAPSVRSSKSADSLKPTWPKKVNEFIIARKGGSSSKNSTLTANNLEEFNKRNAIQEEKRYSARSPYYKGLTDSSKLINRQKLLAESKEERTSSSLNVSSGNKNIQHPSSSETRDKRVIRTTIGEELGIRSKGVRRCVRKSKHRSSQLDQGKPLRERASEMQTNIVQLPAPAPPLTSPPKLSLPSPPPTPLILQTSSQDEEIESVPLPPSPTQTVDEKDTINENDITVPAEQTDKRYIWADKYRPNALKDFLCNRNTALELKALAETDCSNLHYIFAGQPGVGKRTMIFALLREVFGHDKVQGEGVPSIQVNVKESTKHVEINLSETKGYEKHVIVELINERKNKTSRRSAPCNHNDCKAIVLCEADKLSTDALLYTKWMIERYEGCYKVFFCCSDITKLQPIKSICKVVHLQKPSDDEIVDVLEFIAKREGIELPHQMAARIASNSKSNLRQAIRSFEATWHFNTSLTENQEIKTGWEEDIAKIAKNIIEEQSPKQLYDIRGKLQNLIEHNVSAEFIFNTMVEELKSNLDDQFHKDMDTLKMKYNINSNNLEQGKSDNDAVKKIVHKFMRIEGRWPLGPLLGYLHSKAPKETPDNLSVTPAREKIVKPTWMNF
ncbi:hypothetical protein RND71_001430 [Anisodus tanguticus]|uniref:Replication factor C subunit 3 n=1 Tax=Anisodus tanguticus TaxID=243964 RepID=A0AAE1VQW9_9SOLA|nr:hypothetical protein RND71_001430 [Anisodus tanguticus]